MSKSSKAKKPAPAVKAKTKPKETKKSLPPSAPMKSALAVVEAMPRKTK